MDNIRAVQILRDAGTWLPAVIPFAGGYRIYSGYEVIGSGATVDAAMDSARRVLPAVPPVPIFYSEGLEVKRVEGWVATARSKAVAERIANALNQYMPDRRGR